MLSCRWDYGADSDSRSFGSLVALRELYVLLFIVIGSFLVLIFTIQLSFVGVLLLVGWTLALVTKFSLAFRALVVRYLLVIQLFFLIAALMVSTCIKQSICLIFKFVTFGCASRS